MGSIDQSQDEQTSVQLPIFDVADRSTENGRRVVEAAIKYGFLYVSPNSTPFTKTLVDQQFELSKTFFSQPTSEKETYVIGNDNRGWSAMHNEILDPAKQSKEFKEAFNMGEFDEHRMPQQKMPGCFSAEQNLEQLRAFEEACKSTCGSVLDLLGIGLEVEEGADWFSSRHDSPSGCIVRLLHYPSLSEGIEYSPDKDVRAGAHSDYGSITLLFQRPSQPGLEIRPSERSDTWLPVPVFPSGYPSSTFPPILVNIGDLMSYWTDGLLRSTVHRVIFPKDTKAGEDRYSIAYFCHPLDTAELVAIPSQMVREHKVKVANGKTADGQGEQGFGYGGGMNGDRALTAKEHLMRRLGATYNHRVERDTPL